VRALLQRDAKLLAEVQALEAKINEAHIEVDSACMEALVRLSPVAADLRLILAIIKINVDLERMGDQAVNISHNARHYLADVEIVEAIDLPGMADLVREMVRESLDAFMKEDPFLAQEVLEKDDAVDEHKNQAFRALSAHMKKNPEAVDASLDLLLIARNLERLADHATNIAESVIFVYTGEDVRHGSAHPGAAAAGQRAGSGGNEGGRL
jgi:phosphate transport system protein